jgi:hypothetical protein
LRREPAILLGRAREFGLEQRPDNEILTFAATQGWTVVSHDVNTMPAAAHALMEKGEPIGGLIMVHQ